MPSRRRTRVIDPLRGILSCPSGVTTLGPGSPTLAAGRDSFARDRAGPDRRADPRCSPRSPTTLARGQRLHPPVRPPGARVLSVAGGSAPLPPPSRRSSPPTRSPLAGSGFPRAPEQLSLCARGADCFPPPTRAPRGRPPPTRGARNQRLSGPSTPVVRASLLSAAAAREARGLGTGDRGAMLSFTVPCQLFPSLGWVGEESPPLGLRDYGAGGHGLRAGERRAGRRWLAEREQRGAPPPVDQARS